MGPLQHETCEVQVFIGFLMRLCTSVNINSFSYLLFLQERMLRNSYTEIIPILLIATKTLYDMLLKSKRNVKCEFAACV